MKKINFPRFIVALALLVFAPMVVSFVASAAYLIEPEFMPTLSFRISAVLFAAGLVKGFLKIPSVKGLALSDGFVISDTTYAGEAASQFIVKALTGADTIMGGHVYIKDNIKKKFTIPRWDADYESLIQDRAATPTSKGSMNITGKDLNPQDYMIYMEFNPRDFEDHWFATQLNPTLIDRSLPYSVESVVVQEVLKRHAKYFNKAIWRNDMSLSTIYKYWNGFLKNMSNDTDVVDVSSPVTLTNSNIASEFERGYILIPAALKFDKNMKYFVSYKTMDLYRQFQQAQTYKGVDVTKDGIMEYNGRQVCPIADFPDDTYVIAKGMATPESNLWIGLNSIADEGLQLSRLQNNSELWFIKMLMKADVETGFGEEIVAYNV